MLSRFSIQTVGFALAGKDSKREMRNLTHVSRENRPKSYSDPPFLILIEETLQFGPEVSSMPDTLFPVSPGTPSHDALNATTLEIERFASGPIFA